MHEQKIPYNILESLNDEEASCMSLSKKLIYFRKIWYQNYDKPETSLMAKTRVYIALTGNVIKAIKMLQKYYNMALYVIDVSVSNIYRET